MTATGDYTRQIPIGATPEKVFDTLTTAAQFASWWAPATGSAAEASELSITFDSIEDPLVLQVKQATRSSIPAQPSRLSRDRHRSSVHSRSPGLTG
jgi:hypothetical protein